MIALVVGGRGIAEQTGVNGWGGVMDYKKIIALIVMLLQYNKFEDALDYSIYLNITKSGDE